MSGLRLLIRRLFDDHATVLLGLTVLVLAAPAYAQDINGDGRVDAVFTQKQRYNQVCFGNGSGAFTNCVDLIGSGDFTLSNQINTTDAALVDFDADGDLDIALAMEGHASVVCVNNGGGDFNSGLGCVPTYGFNTHPFNAQEVVAADLDGDGHQDLLYANGGNSGAPFNQPNMVCFGFSTLATVCYEFGTDAPSTGLAIGDVDGDGDKDVIVSNRGAANEVCLYNGRTQYGVNFDCRPMPASVYDEYSYINGTWVLQTKTVNPIPPTLSNAVAVGKIGFTFNVEPDGLFDVAFANDGKNVVCLGNGNWTGTNVGFTCRELPEATSYGATTATARSVDVAIGEVSPSYKGDEILFANAEVGNVMCTNGTQCQFAFHPNLPAHQVWWAAGNTYVTSSQEPDHQPATGIAIREIDFLQAGTSGRYPNDVVVATLGTSRSFMRADCCTTSNFVTANATLIPTSVTLSGGHLGAPVDGPPTLFGANNVTVEATSANGAVATFTVTAIDNEDGARPVSCTPSSGSTFGLGNTTVTCTSSDTTGHTGSTTLMVTVRDTTGPVVTVPDNFVFDATPGLVTTTIAFTTSASDLVEGSVAVTCTVGSVGVTAGHQFTGGTTNLNCFARDSRLNYGDASFSITVRTDIDNDGIRDDVDIDDDGDGIADGVDAQSTAASSGYAFSATNTGTVTRNNWTVAIAPTPSGSAYSLRATLSGAGTAPAVITANCEGISKQLRLDTAGESIDWRCEVQPPSSLPRTLAVKFVAGTPEFWKYSCGLEYQGPGQCGYIKITGAVNNAVSAGSPVTADPSNTEPTEVTIYNSIGTASGTITLEPGESVDVQEVADPDGGANLLQLELINGGADGTVTVTLWNQQVTLQSGNGPATFSLPPVKAPSTTTVSFGDGPFTYTGSPFTALATVSPDGDATIVYSGDCVNAGSSCTATATYDGSATHSGSSATASITIDPAPTTTTVSFGAASFIYSGSPIEAMASAGTTIVYSGECTNVGSCTATATTAGDANHLGSSAVATATITKAPTTTTVSFGGGPFVYNGSAFTATASSSFGTPVIAYSGNCTNVGTCTATATYDGDANHTGSLDSVTITLAPAVATVTATSYNVEYDGQPHSATFTITGVNGQTGAAVGTVTHNTTHTNVGVYNDVWSFAGENYVSIGATGITNRIKDTTAPVLTVPASQTLEATSAAGAAASFAATATDAVGVTSLTYSHPSGSVFPVGTTIVTVTATDAAGNTTNGSFTITVEPQQTALPGSMHGEGKSRNGRDTYTFNFRVVERAPGVERGHLTIRFDGSDRGRKADQGFKSTSITSVMFSDDPAFRSGNGRKAPPADTVVFGGTGTWGGMSGYSFEARANDQGEGRPEGDTFEVVIRQISTGQVVASTNGIIHGGNIQSDRLKPGRGR